jgi:hypothetical protein
MEILVKNRSGIDDRVAGHRSLQRQDVGGKPAASAGGEPDGKWFVGSRSNANQNSCFPTLQVQERARRMA